MMNKTKTLTEVTDQKLNNTKSNRKTYPVYEERHNIEDCQY